MQRCGARFTFMLENVMSVGYANKKWESDLIGSQNLDRGLRGRSDGKNTPSERGWEF